MCHEVSITPIPCLPEMLGSAGTAGKGGEGGRGGGFLRSIFTPYYSTLILLAINSDNIPNLSLSFL